MYWVQHNSVVAYRYVDLGRGFVGWWSETWCYSPVWCYKYKTRNVHVTQHWCAFTKPLLQWKNNKYCIFLSLGARACACARVFLLIQHTTRLRCVVCGRSGSTTCFDIISETARFSRGKKITGKKMCFFCTTFIWNISHSNKNSARYCHECENVYMKSIRYSC
jgi:hypothetical protein